MMRRDDAHVPLCVSLSMPCGVQNVMALQNFSDSPSHRIFRHMHEVLNIDKNKN